MSTCMRRWDSLCAGERARRRSAGPQPTSWSCWSRSAERECGDRHRATTGHRHHGRTGPCRTSRVRAEDEKGERALPLCDRGAPAKELRAGGTPCRRPRGHAADIEGCLRWQPAAPVITGGGADDAGRTGRAGRARGTGRADRPSRSSRSRGTGRTGHGRSRPGVALRPLVPGVTREALWSRGTRLPGLTLRADRASGPGFPVAPSVPAAPSVPSSPSVPLAPVSTRCRPSLRCRPSVPGARLHPLHPEAPRVRPHQQRLSRPGRQSRPQLRRRRLLRQHPRPRSLLFRRRDQPDLRGQPGRLHPGGPARRLLPLLRRHRWCRRRPGLPGLLVHPARLRCPGRPGSPAHPGPLVTLEDLDAVVACSPCAVTPSAPVGAGLALDTMQTWSPWSPWTPCAPVAPSAPLCRRHRWFRRHRSSRWRPCHPCRPGRRWHPWRRRHRWSRRTGRDRRCR